MNRLASALVAAVLAVDGQQQFVFQDDRITESSDIVLVGDLAFTTNDSGDGPRVYVIDPATGRTVGVTTYGGDAVDVEALAAGPDDTLWIGDIGDNRAVRDQVTVYSIPLPGAGNHTAKATAYDLRYEDGPRDAETLLVQPDSGRLYVVSKGLLGGSVYEAPEQLSASKPNVLTKIGSVGGLVTDGVFFSDGRHVVLRDYSKAHVLDESFDTVTSFALPAQEQGEGIALDGQSVVLSSEGEHAPVLRMAMPANALAALAGETPSVLPSTLPDPDPVPDEVNDKSILLRVVPWLIGLGWAGLLGYLAIGLVRRRTAR